MAELKWNHPTIVQLVKLDDEGDSLHRMRWPAEEISRRNPQWRVINLDSQSVERYEWALEADLLIVIQSHDTDLLPILEKRRKGGKKTLVEYNDNFYETQPWSPVASTWGSPLIWQAYELFIEKSDGLLVTGPGLVELFKSKGFKTPTHILENHFLEDPLSLKELSPLKNKNLTIGWAGSLGHMADLLSVAPLLRKLVSDFPEIQISVMGNKAIPDLLRLPASQFQFKHWSSLKDYLDFLKPIHLGIAPLLPTAYNRCRSDIKAVEMAGQLVLPLLQNEINYSTFLGKTDCPSFKNLSELDEILRDLIQNPKAIAARAEAAYTYVNEQRIHRLREERARLYESHLPSKINTSFPWPMGPGYHEWAKSLDSVTPSQQRLMNIQKLWATQKEKALTEIERALEVEPYDQDLAYSYCQILLKLQVSHEQILKVIDSFIQRFQRNKRFQILKIQLLLNEDRRKKEWAELFHWIESAPKKEVDFFLTPLVSLIQKQLGDDAWLLPLAEKLHLSFPEKASLRYVLAHHYENLGERKKAFPHFLWLREKKEIQTYQKNQPLNLELSYLEAWVAALEARNSTASE